MDSARFQRQFPDDLRSYWEESALKGYRMVLKQFLPLAVEITDHYYPRVGSTPSDTETKLDEIVERHFAFRLRTPATGQCEKR